MTIHACLRTCLRNAGKSAARRIAVLLVGAVVLSGCGDSGPSLLPVRAVAAGVASLAPFFDEDAGLGRDEPKVISREPHSGLQQGNAPGLYGGTRKTPKICDVDKLENFLTDPENRKKAQVWADIAGVKVEGIGDYLDDLTPVLLRHDTLVKNHDYKKGKGVPFDALLEAGIAVLVDEQGLPAVKCSCGNPLRAFDDNPELIDVKFENGNKEWESYDESALVVVKPAPGQLKEIKLVDVEDPDQGISRDVGTAGESDETFDARERQTVPDVAGMTFGEASAALADKGLAATVDEDEMPPGNAPVTGSSPGPGSELEFGDAVALEVDWKPTESSRSDGGTGPGSTPPETSSSPSDGGRSPSPTESSSDGSGTPSGTESSPENSPSRSESPSEKPPTESPTPTPEPTTPTSTPDPTTPTPTPKPTTPTRTPDPTTPNPVPSTSSAPAPDPSQTEESELPVDPTTSDPGPSGDPPSEDTGNPGDPGDPGEDPGDPVEDPAQPVWI